MARKKKQGTLGNVQLAFKLLLEELDSLHEEMNKQQSSHAKNQYYDKVQKLTLEMKSISNCIANIKTLSQNWRAQSKTTKISQANTLVKTAPKKATQLVKASRKEKTKSAFKDNDSKYYRKKAISLLGGGMEMKLGRFQYTELDTKEIVIMKYSKVHGPGKGKWGRIYFMDVTPGNIENIKKYKVTHFALVLGNEGVIKLPARIMEQYITTTSVSQKAGIISAYKIYCIGKPAPALLAQGNVWKNCDKYFHKF